MRVQFWGTRCSVPVPGPHTVEFGGNTSCVEVRTASGTLFVLDCGTGLRELGRHLLAEAAPAVTGHIFISHTHWDHIQGFPFFEPFFQADNHFTLYGVPHLDTSLEAALTGQMQDAYFPVRLADMAASMTFQEITGNAVVIDGAVVRLHHLNHTAPCFGYRIEADDAAVVYLTDTEPCASYMHAAGRSLMEQSSDDAAPRLARQLQHEADDRLAAFARGADLLIMDAQYSPEEYTLKRGWGHSHLDHVIDFAIAAEVRRVALFHHDPDHSDAVLASFERYCQERARQEQPGLQLWAAREGAVIDL